MFQGISLSLDSVPVPMLETEITARQHRRSPQAQEELWFLLRDQTPVLPIYREGVFQFAAWGSRSAKGYGIWQCRQESLQAGNWSHLEPVEVLIPATFGLDSGVWYGIREGVKGVLITVQQQPIVYILTQPASHYYEVMCARAERMPVFENQYI